VIFVNLQKLTVIEITVRQEVTCVNGDPSKWKPLARKKHNIKEELA
jgi:hypothetical protein